jgi:hypothetical protein
MSEQGDISDSELQRRVVYSLLMAAVKLARVFGMPLKELTGWVETAYFREVRAQGLTLRQSSQALDVSHRTAVRLSKQLRESFFFLPEASHNLQRRVEFMLGPQAMSAARIRQVLPDAEAAQVDQAIAHLLEQGRIREIPGRTLMYQSVGSVRRLPRDTWMARIGALNSFVENLAGATYGRFFNQEPQAFARTVSFPVAPEDFERLQQLYEEQLRPAIEELGKDAEENPGSVPMQLSLCWAPYEYLQQTENEESEREVHNED